MNYASQTTFTTEVSFIIESYTGWGLCIGTANGNYWITDFWLGISKKVNNIISTSLKNTLFQKITGAWLEKWACHTDFEISGSKIEKGVAGSVFKPHPCNFLESCFFINVEMILLTYLDPPNQKSVSW